MSGPVTTFPPPPFHAALLRRAGGLWLLVRAGILLVGVMLEVPVPELVFLTAPASAFLVVLAAWLTILDARRRREALFLANLGVSGSVLFLLAALPPLVGELVMRGLGSP